PLVDAERLVEARQRRRVLVAVTVEPACGNLDIRVVGPVLLNLPGQLLSLVVLTRRPQEIDEAGQQPGFVSVDLKRLFNAAERLLMPVQIAMNPSCGCEDVRVIGPAFEGRRGS